MKKTILVVAAWVVFISLVLFAVNMVLKPFQVLDKVTDPDRIIYTYEWFFDQLGRARAWDDQIPIAENAIEAFKEDHDNLDSYANTTELSRLRAVEQGLRNKLASAVRDYNAKAENRTRGIFQDWKLPDRICVNSGQLAEGVICR